MTAISLRSSSPAVQPPLARAEQYRLEAASLAAVMAAELASYDVDELVDTARYGHPRELRAAAKAELRNRKWRCLDCGKVEYETPSEYDNPDDSEGPLCARCARGRQFDRPMRRPLMPIAHLGYLQPGAWTRPV